MSMEVLVKMLMDEWSEWAKVRDKLHVMLTTMFTFVADSLEELRPHSFISKAQSRYLNQLKENLASSSAIFLGDFAENVSLVVQDEIQSLHWNNTMCTLHPVVIFYRKAENSISHFWYTIISDDNTHDVHFVYKVISIIMADLKEKLLCLNSLHFFTDGCAGQYKNRKTCTTYAKLNMIMVWMQNGISLLHRMANPRVMALEELSRDSLQQKA